MIELLEVRKCLDLGTCRTLSMMLKYTDTTTRREESIEVKWNIHLSYDRTIEPNDLLL